MANMLLRGLPSAGIYFGPLAWLASTQANYSLAPWSCAHQMRVVPFIALALAAISLFGGFLSWRALRRAAPVTAEEKQGGGRPHNLLALVGMAMALLFAAIILLHAAAGLVFSGCER
jgi:hypothetical protein